MSQKIITALVKPNDKLPLDAYIAYPSGGGSSYPGIVVIQEIFGVNAHIRDVTERIARLGYVAIAPAIFQRIAPGIETGCTPQDILTGRSYKGQTKASELLSDIQATINYLKDCTQVKKDAGFGSYWFLLWGSCCLSCRYFR